MIRKLLFAIFTICMLMGNAPSAYAQILPEAPEVKDLTLKDCVVTGAQISLGKNPKGEVVWVGATIVDLNDLPKLSPSGTQYLHVIFLYDRTAFEDWISENMEVRFYNKNGLVAFSKDGEVYIISRRLCTENVVANTIWTETDKFTFLKSVQITVPETRMSFESYFFVGSELTKQELDAVQASPAGLIGTYSLSGPIGGGVESSPSDIKAKAAGDLYFVSSEKYQWISLGFKVPLNTEILVVTKYQGCSGDCSHITVQKIILMNVPFFSMIDVPVADTFDFTNLVGWGE